MDYPAPIEELASHLRDLPGVGRRSAERYALAMLEWDPEQLSALGRCISELHETVRFCLECGNLTDRELCGICTTPNRDPTTVCVVESARQIPIIERSARYRGLYHVLGGRLSPLDGIDIEDLNIESLFRRVAEKGVKEVIVATSPDVEGQATAAYLAELLDEKFKVTVSRIALGVPVGSDLTFADAATMGMAIDSRRPL